MNGFPLPEGVGRRVPCNASNGVRGMGTGAAEKAVSCHDGFVTRTRVEETAYGPVRRGRPVAPGRPLARRVPEAFSHPRPLEASQASPRPAAAAALGRAAFGAGPAR